MGWGFVRRGGSHLFWSSFPARHSKLAPAGPKVRTEEEECVGQEGSRGPWQLPRERAPSTADMTAQSVAVRGRPELTKAIGGPAGLASVAHRTR